MDRQQLMDEVYEIYGEWLEMESDNIVMVEILTGLLLRERQKNESLKAELKRCKFAGVA